MRRLSIYLAALALLGGALLFTGGQRKGNTYYRDVYRVAFTAGADSIVTPPWRSSYYVIECMTTDTADTAVYTLYKADGTTDVITRYLYSSGVVDVDVWYGPLIDSIGVSTSNVTHWYFMTFFEDN